MASVAPAAAAAPAIGAISSMKINDAMAQAKWAEKKWVWVADKEEGFIAGWIVKENGDNVEIELTNEQV